MKRLPGLRIFLALLACYLLILARWGYEYGRNDQLQIIAYSMYMNDGTLFANDPFVQDISAKVPNERYVFAKFMSFFGEYMEAASLVLHAAFTLFLLLMLYRVGKLFIETDYLVWLGLLVLFVPLYGVNLGGNELYYNTFFVSTPAKSIGLYGLLLFLKNRYAWSFFWLGIAAVLQPIVGLQLFLTCTAILVLGTWLKRFNYDWRQLLSWGSLFMVTGGLWIIAMKFFFEDKGGDDATFYTIFFEFRAPHHYLPWEFSTKNYLLLVPMLLLGFGFYFFNNYKITLFYLISLLGILIYYFGLAALENVNIATLQWFKTTMWLEAFSVLALMAMLERGFGVLKHKWLTRLAFPTLLVTGFSVGLVLIFARGLIFWPVPFDFGDQYRNDPAVTISLAAKANSDRSALFLHPIGFTELKVYGERSGFVDYKALSHRKPSMESWYGRIQAAYDVSRETQKLGFEVYPTANENLVKLTETQLQDLKAKWGITHLLTFANHQLAFKELARNKEYVIYVIE